MGDLTCSNFGVDPVTGFLDVLPGMEAGKVSGYGVGPSPSFVSVKKTQYIDLLKVYYPNYSKCSAEIGITNETYKNHYEFDIAFRKAVDEVVKAKTDEINVVRYEMAKTKSGALDRMAYLNAMMPEVYDRDKTITIKHEMSRDEATARAARLRESIDTDAVDVYEKLRSKTRQDRVKQLRKVRDRD